VIYSTVELTTDIPEPVSVNLQKEAANFSETLKQTHCTTTVWKT